MYDKPNTVNYINWPRFYPSNNYINTSLWSIVYDFFHRIFNRLFPSLADKLQDQHLVLNVNGIRNINNFDYKTGKSRQCAFWRIHENL